MRALLSVVLLTILSTAALGGGCTPRPAQAPGEDDEPLVGRDSVVYVDPGPQPTDLLQEREAVLSGEATYETMTVGEWGVAAATQAAEREAAERALASGAYLGDALTVVRFAPEGGAATVDLGSDIGAPFETECIVRFDQGVGGMVDFTVEGEAGAGGRGMPSVLGVTFDLREAHPAVAMLLNRPGGTPSEIARAELPESRTDAFAYRLGVQYTPGSVVVRLDGAVVLEAAARLGGGSATATIRVSDSGRLLRWTMP